MKIFRYLGMAMFAMMLSVNFAACSSDDNDDDKQEDMKIVQKYIATEHWISDGSDEEITNVSYNDKNQVTVIDCVIKLSLHEGDVHTIHRTFTFDYDSHQIVYEEKLTNEYDGIKTEGYNNRYLYNFVMDAYGRIVEVSKNDASMFTARYKYDENNHLIGTENIYDPDKTLNHTGKIEFKFIWQDDNLVRMEDISDTGSSAVTNFEYGDIFNKGNIQMPVVSVDNLLFSEPEVSSILMSAGLFGKLSKNLPTSRSYSYIEDENFTYELDEQGFVKSMSMINDTIEQRRITYTYKN